MDIEHLLRLAAGCEAAIRERYDDLTTLRAELDALDGRTCVGREWWRDSGHPTKVAKLYILHSIDQACPIHGKPEPGGRLRVYVGSDRGRVVEARAAMGRETRRRELAASARDVEQGLSSCGHYLRRLYRELGYALEGR